MNRAEVFISHTSADAAAARRLQEALEAAGIATFSAAESLEPGENWYLRAGKAIAEATAIVIVFSRESARSHTTRRDWQFGLTSKKHAGRVFAAVVPGTPARAVPWIFRHLQSVVAERSWAATVRAVASTVRPLFRGRSLRRQRGRRT